MPQSDKINELAAIGETFPTLKRKRKCEGYLEQTAVDADAESQTCFTNAAFSSTPKKATARRRTPTAKANNFVQNPCLEVKSIADIVNNAVAPRKEPNEVTDVTSTPTQNPYEVVRKPPKKKKRETELNEACFENPALNLELPEKQFNPYEVVRAVPTKQPNPSQTNCFVNAALNLRIQDASAARNPFEIQRCASVPDTVSSAGVENPALDEGPAVEHTDLRIALPFKPTLGCRIDFSNIPLEQLTPSKLLADKLVFSPVLAVPKRSLDSASGDSSMDIGRELDRYQLELENSINEAKMRKNHDTGALEVKTAELTVQVDVEQRITFTQRLEEIIEEDEEKENECVEEEFRKTTTTQACTTTTHFESTEKVQIAPVANNNQFEVLRESEKEDVAYASESDEDEFDFKSPAPFVRAYQRSAALAPQSVGSKESLHSTGSAESASNQHKKSLNVRNIIRKSIRKLMHSNKQIEDDIAKNDADTKEELLPENGIKEKEKHISAYKMIRNSLRRKAPTKTMPMTAQQTPLAKAEISIIDTSERTMKLRAEFLPQADGVRSKHTLRSSLRRSTREMGQHFMKTVFHKNQEAYDFSK